MDRDATERTTRLCDLEGAEVAHVRIDRFNSGAGFSSIQFFLGYEERPAGAQAPVGPGQFKIMAYGSTPELLYGYFGEPEGEGMGAGSVAFGEGLGADFGPDAEATICFDIHRGTDELAPMLVLWVDGAGGADCRDFATLSFDNAFAVEQDWLGQAGAIDRVDTAWLYQHTASPARPVVTLLDRGALSCEFIPERINTYQTLCAPAAGASFFRVDGLETLTNNSYWFLDVAQEDAGNFGSTSEDSGNFVAVGGQSNTGANVTWFKFDGVNEGGGPGANVERFTWELDSGDGLYVDGPTQFCLALANDADQRAVSRFWATGAQGADCSDLSTLTAASALDTSLWDAPLAEGAELLNAFRASNDGFGASRILVFAAGPDILEASE